MRRSNGTGSIVKLGGNRRKPWAVRISVPDEKGRPKQKYINYHRTSAEAQAALDEWLHSPSSPMPMGKREAASTLLDVYEVFCVSVMPKISKALQTSYRAAWNQRLSPLGHRRFADLRVEDFQKILDAGAKSGLSQSSLNNMRGLIKHLYAVAYQRYITDRDLSVYLYTPEVPAKAPRRAFTEKELRAIVALAHKGNQTAQIALVMCYSGLRINELLGMEQQAFHAQPVPHLIGGLKSEAGRNRVIPVHPKVEQILVAFANRHGTALICDENGKRIAYKGYLKSFAEMAAALKIKGASPHWCRHTFISMAKVSGVDDLACRRIVGHADRTTTDHYTHLPPEFLYAEIQKIP